MKEIVINNFLEKEVGIRMNYGKISEFKNGENYFISEKIAENGKVAIIFCVKEGHEEIDAKIEFLKMYMNCLNVKSGTKSKIIFKIHNLNKEQVNHRTIQKDFSEGSGMMISDIEKFKYRSNAHNIESVINFVIDIRMRRISPFSVSASGKFPTGTIYTWYKNNNEFRILFVLYTKEDEEILKYFSGYKLEKVIELNQEIAKEIAGNKEISEEIQKLFIEKINCFSEFLNQRLNEKINDNYEDNKIVKLIIDKEDIWQVFADTYKDEIFKELYKNKKILVQIIQNINQ